MDVERKSGSELTNKEISEIDSYRAKEFGSKSETNPLPGNKDWMDLFFFLKEEDGQTLSFGRVENLPILFQDKTFDVLCVSNVVATQKGIGYGKALMEKIKEYAQENGKTLIGFCETTLLPFYQKCGFEVLSRGDNKFVYVDSAGQIVPGVVPGEVFYVEGADEMFKKILSAADKTVKVSRKE